MSEYTKFIQALARNLGPFHLPFTDDYADMFVAHARMMQMFNELFYSHGSTWRQRQAQILSERSLVAFAGMLGLHIHTSRNPAGCPIRLMFPDGSSNSPQGGWCVPLRRD